jgi:hypothetical protein
VLAISVLTSLGAEALDLHGSECLMFHPNRRSTPRPTRLFRLWRRPMRRLIRRPVLVLLVVPVLLALVDPETPHRAGAPRGPLARLRVRLARWVEPGMEDGANDADDGDG